MRVPKLHFHKHSGQYFVHWGGQRHYLGKDKAEAERQYVQDQLPAWQAWWAEKQKNAEQRRRRKTVRVVDVAEAFIEAKWQEVGESARGHYTRHLARFLTIFGRFDADLIKPSNLQALKSQMVSQGFAPKTVNHDIGSVKTMWRWASALDLVEPVDFGGVRNMPVGPVQDTSQSVEKTRRAFEMCDDKLAPWFALNYLALLRPSEVVRVVAGEGEFVAEGVFRLDRGKMDSRASIKRHCLLSPLALSWLDKAEPHWTRQDSYSTVFRKQCPFGPKSLQKSAATHLAVEHDADPADIELLLGHVSGRLKVTYYAPAWQRLRKIAALLTL